MKQLRILTGIHAGARIRLTQSRYAIGPGSDSELQISDWKHELATLEYDKETQVIQILEGRSMQGGEAAARSVLLADFHPARFGDTVLCAGPLDDALWPADIEVLKRLLKPLKAAGKSGDAAPSTRPARFALVGGVAFTTLLAAFTYVASNGMTKAKAQVPVQPMEYRVSTALAAAGVSTLTVRNAGDKVVVEGLVDGPTDLVRVRQTLQRFDGTGLLQKYASADDVSHSISDALADPALHVRYAGSGVFVVEGSIPHVESLRASVGRIATDLGGLVRRIELAVSEAQPPSKVHIDAMLVDADVNYVQTRDGTKHLVIPAQGQARALIPPSLN